MQDFRELRVWQKAHELSLTSYKLTSTFPPSEQFGLTNQIRRCVVSITANIAEGRGRGSDADFKRFIQIALGSTCELESHLILAHDLKYLKKSDFSQLIEDLTEVRKMLITLRKRLQSS